MLQNDLAGRVWWWPFLDGVTLSALAVLSFLTFGAIYSSSTTLVRRRPLVLGRAGLCALALLLPALGTLLRPDLFPGWAGLFGLQTLLLVIRDTWITVGARKDNIECALRRSMEGTLTRGQWSPLGVRLDRPSGTIHLRTVLGRLQLITFNLPAASKRQRLLKKVFKKFVQNSRL